MGDIAQVFVLGLAVKMQEIWLDQAKAHELIVTGNGMSSIRTDGANQVDGTKLSSRTVAATANIFQKIQAGALFLGVRRLDTALDFSISALDTIQSSLKPEHSRTPSLQKTSWATAELGQSPTFRAFASSRETPSPSA
jgi:hypothetical protein